MSFSSLSHRAGALACTLLLARPAAAQVTVGSFEVGLLPRLEGEGLALEAGQLLVGAQDRATLYQRSGWSWVPRAQWSGGDPSFGRAVDLDGGRVAIGHPHAGRVLLLTPRTGGWDPLELLDPGPGRGFGATLKLDGARLLVGAVDRVVLLEDVGGAWSPVLSAVGSGDFGYSLALSGDVALVQSRLSSAGGFQAGDVAVYERAPDGRWSRTQTLIPPTPGDFQRFGESLLVAGDRLFVAAPSARVSGSGGTSVGAVHAYRRGAAGWELAQTLVPFDAHGQSIGFGFALALAGDRLVVGAPGRSATRSPFPRNHGAAYLFSDGPAGWQPAQLVTPTGRLLERLGFGTELAFEGDQLVVRQGLDSLESPSRVSTVDFGVDPAALRYTPDTVWEAGATVRCDLAPGRAFAGHRYLLLGSMSGTSPGIPVGRLRIPLVPDPWFSTTLRRSPEFLQHTTGVLDGDGTARAWIRVPPAVAQVLQGPLWHSLVVLDPLSGRPVHVGAPRALSIRP